MTDDFKLIDGAGREFSPSSEATTALMMSGVSKDFVWTELQPGLQRDSATAFEIPNQAWKSKVKLVVPEKGLLGSEKVVIKLN